MKSSFSLIGEQLALFRGDRLLFKQCNFDLSNGETLQIKGENGAGKTSLLRMICGFLDPDEGKLNFNQTSLLKDRSEFYQQTLYLGHQLGIKSNLTVAENLAFYIEINGASQRCDISEAVDKVGLAGFENQLVAHLSQGQKRRVTLARLLLEEAVLWILDEPFVALDVKGQHWLQNTLGEHAKAGGGIILTSHQAIELEVPIKSLTLQGGGQ
ncbi:MAG: cytochrome c biogenesis heme-transporting ATPase CcmA [Gammaproteobacteria bacterium]|nr:cytochrome c biogenesis heme-transporting ATPase CcmA [Gammaproteobacteria bacterium]